MSNSTSNTPPWMIDGEHAPAVTDLARPMSHLLQQLLRVEFKNDAPTQPTLGRYQHSWKLAAAAALAVQVLRGELAAGTIIFHGESADHLQNIAAWLIKADQIKSHAAMVDHLVELGGVFHVWMGQKSDAKEYASLLFFATGRLGKIAAKSHGTLRGPIEVATTDVNLNQIDPRIVSNIERLFLRQLDRQLPALAVACG